MNADARRQQQGLGVKKKEREPRMHANAREGKQRTLGKEEAARGSRKAAENAKGNRELGGKKQRQGTADLSAIVPASRDDGG